MKASAGVLIVGAFLGTIVPGSEAPAPGCLGESDRAIGRMDYADSLVQHGGLLLGRWVSRTGTLTLQIAPEMQGDVVHDAVGGTWQTRGTTTSVRRVSYEPSARILTLEFLPDGPAPFSRLALERDGLALVSIPAAGADAPPLRLAREVRQRHVPFDRFTQSRAGLSMRVEAGSLHVTAAGGARAAGRLTSMLPMPLTFAVDVDIQPRGADGFGAGSFVCIGAVNDEPAYWDPHRHLMAGRIQGARGGLFTMETFSGGQIRRFASVPAGAAGGRLRMIREHGRIFMLFDEGRGWMPIGTDAADLWDKPRLVILFGNHASRGLYPALDFSITDLRLTGE